MVFPAQKQAAAGQDHAQNAKIRDGCLSGFGDFRHHRHRGTVFGALLPKSTLLAWLVSVILFSGIHILGYIGLGDGGLLLLCFLQYIFPAAALCWLYQSTGSLLAPILMHMAYNAIGILFVR